MQQILHIALHKSFDRASDSQISAVHYVMIIVVAAIVGTATIERATTMIMVTVIITSIATLTVFEMVQL